MMNQMLPKIVSQSIDGKPVDQGKPRVFMSLQDMY